MDTHVPNLERSLQKTMELFKKIEEKTGFKANHEITYKLLRAVLHTLRDRLQPQEVAHLGSQLPLIIRGMYYEDWNPSKVPEKLNLEEFIQKVQEHTYLSQENFSETVRRVFWALEEFMGLGSLEKIKATFPKELVDFLTPLRD